MDDPWRQILEGLMEHGMSSGTLLSLFKGTRLERRDENGTWTLYVTNNFARDWIASKHVSGIREAMQEALIPCTDLVVEVVGESA